MEEDLSRFVPKVHFELLPIKNLVSSQTYQRNLSLSHIQRTVENFDLHQINPVKVSRRDGINYVFNGQHTVRIYGRHIPCKSIVSLRRRKTGYETS